MAALSEISSLSLQAAADVQTGSHTKSPVELMLEFGQLLKDYEEFLEVEALSVQ